MQGPRPVISRGMEHCTKIAGLVLTALMLFVMSGHLVHARILPGQHVFATTGAALAPPGLPQHDSHDATLPCPTSECAAGVIFVSQATADSASPIAAIRYAIPVRIEPDGARPAPDPLPPKGYFLLT